MNLSLPYQPILASFRQTPLGRLAYWAGCGIYMRVLGAPSLTSEREHALLRRLCAGMVGGCRMLEIGSWMGASAVVLGAEARARAGRLVCVDWWAGEDGNDADPLRAWARSWHTDPMGAFWRRIRKAELVGTVMPMRGKSQDVLPLLMPYLFHFVWIDGDHRYKGVRFDIEQARRLIAPGGIICGHDYDPGSDVALAANEAFGSRLHVEGRIWWARA